MKYLSVCSGIEAATVAWHHMGWEPVGFSEIEKFPSQVLDAHYPTVPKLGDMTKYKEWNIEKPELLVGGTPCQSFSVAGLRKGLDDPRGNLALVYLGIADHYKPQWIVWENVPGVLSSNGGRDFGAFTGALAELGYGFAYRVLDAQWFGVAQRRRRVFVVGYLGDWRPAAAVLFESKSMFGNTKTSTKKREDTATSLVPSVANCLTRRMHKGMNSTLDEGQTPILQPIDVPDVMATLLSSTAGVSRVGNTTTEHVTYIPMAKPVAIQGNLIGRVEGGPEGVGASDEGVMYTLTKGDVHGVAQQAHYRKSRRAQSVDDHETWVQDDVTNTLNTFDLVDVRAVDVVAQPMAVRRLTPVECERLQGFPDNYTNIRDNCPDGPRYKALGNSMAVPVMRWIGERIAQKLGD